MQDFMGREIQVGDTVVWPSRYSSSMWMSSGKVLGFDVRVGYGSQTPILIVQADPDKERFRRVTTKPSKLEAIDRVVVVGRA